jgi:hypothetical protein
MEDLFDTDHLGISLATQRSPKLHLLDQIRIAAIVANTCGPSLETKIAGPNMRSKLSSKATLTSVNIEGDWGDESYYEMREPLTGMDPSRHFVMTALRLVTESNGLFSVYKEYIRRFTITLV